MNRRTVDPAHPDERAIKEVAEAISKGELAVYPTDTLYGLGGLATSFNVVSRVFQVKGRGANKPLTVACDSIGMVAEYAELSNDDAEFMKKHAIEPYTFILRRRNNSLKDVALGGQTVGFRIPAHPVAIALVKAVKSPITATSANKSGAPPTADPTQVDERVIRDVEWFLDAGRCPVGRPSTLVDMTEGRRILR
ncbi:Threonylcarbamoyl-AMP synthase [uncultured archaeon]|nr:Threonylcarbamoyl-AMP synthase [uncultured archaeon]